MSENREELAAQLEMVQASLDEAQADASYLRHHLQGVYTIVESLAPDLKGLSFKQQIQALKQLLQSNRLELADFQSLEAQISELQASHAELLAKLSQAGIE